MTLDVHPRIISVYDVYPAKLSAPQVRDLIFFHLYEKQVLADPGSHLWCIDLESLGLGWSWGGQDIRA